jgi:hypothetical protein
MNHSQFFTLHSSLSGGKEVFLLLNNGKGEMADGESSNAGFDDRPF